MFLLLRAESRNGAQKILHLEKPARPMHRGNAHGGEPRIQNVFAVARRIHPAAVNDRRTCADGDVFRDDAEARAGFREPSFQIGFTGKLVLEHIQIRHAQSVLARSLEKNIIPLKRTEILCGAFAIQSFEELALGIVALELRVRARGNEKQKYCGCEKSEISHAGEKLSANADGAETEHHVAAGSRTAKTHHGAEDRKSTRLNSSHSEISYAVFCLKKKKKQRQAVQSQCRPSRHPTRQSVGSPTVSPSNAPTSRLCVCWSFHRWPGVLKLPLPRRM